MTTRTKRVIKAAAQVVVLGGAVWYLVRTARPHWQSFTSLPQPLGWRTLLAASALWLAAYVGLISLWARSLAWWGARLGSRPALRVFFLANLARYIPGAIWQFAGLAALALEEGVSPLAATAAVLVQQLVLLATGLVLAVVFAPGLLHPYAPALSPPVTLLAALGALALLVVGVPLLLPPVKRFLERRMAWSVPLPQASHAAFARYVAGSALGWGGYGVAFWLFARALLGGAAPGILTAAPAFIAAYVVGILAIFAPGGLVVREAAIVVALTPQVGSDTALLLAVGSRIWLTAVEIIAALVVLAAGRGRAAGPQGLRSTNTN